MCEHVDFWERFGDERYESDLEWLYSLALPLFNNGSGVADELEGCSEGRVVCVVEDESSVS